MLPEISKQMSVPRNSLCLLASLLPNFILTREDLEPFYTQICDKRQDVDIIAAISKFIAEQKEGLGDNSIDRRLFKMIDNNVIQKFLASIKYFQNGTQEGFLQYQGLLSEQLSLVNQQKSKFNSLAGEQVRSNRSNSVPLLVITDEGDASDTIYKSEADATKNTTLFHGMVDEPSHGNKGVCKRHGSVPMLPNISLMSEIVEEESSIKIASKGSSGDSLDLNKKFDLLETNDEKDADSRSATNVSPVPKILIECEELVDTKIHDKEVDDDDDTDIDEDFDDMVISPPPDIKNLCPDNCSIDHKPSVGKSSFCRERRRKSGKYSTKPLSPSADCRTPSPKLMETMYESEESAPNSPVPTHSPNNAREGTPFSCSNLLEIYSESKISGKKMSTS